MYNSTFDNYYVCGATMTKIYNRETKDYFEQKEAGSMGLRFLYNTILGRLVLKLLVGPGISKFSGKYNDSKYSLRKIPKFVKKNNINMDDFIEEDYQNFNDFFTRKIKEEKRPMTKNPKRFISPADSKVLAYDITEDLMLTIKGSTYSLNELVNNEEDLSEFKNGKCLVFRLSVDDYHHYCYPDSGKLLKYNFIPGKLHTVRSISSKYKIYKVNQREYSILETENFDKIVYIEVGAMMVGKIVNNIQENFTKGEEKGYFKLGGSTIVILLKENELILDKDIVNNSKKDIETQVKYHETIGAKK